MTKLQVELEKARKRIEKAVRKKVTCTSVTVSYDHLGDVAIYAWLNSKIIASMYTHDDQTTKQIVRRVQTELDLKV